MSYIAEIVVNCFQICIFVSDNTTMRCVRMYARLLWIAFKFVSLYQIIQHWWVHTPRWRVVNCFQICIFVSDNTTLYSMQATRFKLWIAFKFVSLYQIIQPEPFHRTWIIVVNCFQICIFVSDNTTKLFCWEFLDSCELLSNLYLCIR